MRYDNRNNTNFSSSMNRFGYNNQQNNFRAERPSSGFATSQVSGIMDSRPNFNRSTTPLLNRNNELRNIASPRSGLSNSRPTLPQRNLTNTNEEDSSLNKTSSLRELHKSPKSRVVLTEEKNNNKNKEKESMKEIHRSSPGLSPSRIRDNDRYSDRHSTSSRGLSNSRRDEEEDLLEEEDHKDVRRSSHSSSSSKNRDHDKHSDRHSTSSRSSSRSSRARDEEDEVEDFLEEDNREARRGSRSSSSNRNKDKHSTSSRSSSRASSHRDEDDDFLEEDKEEERSSRSNRTSNRESNRPSNRKARESYRDASIEEEVINTHHRNEKSEYENNSHTLDTSAGGDPYDKYRTVSKRLKKEKLEHEKAEEREIAQENGASDSEKKRFL